MKARKTVSQRIIGRARESNFSTKILLILIPLVQTLIIAWWTYNRKPTCHIDMPDLSNRASIKNSCEVGMRAILAKRPSFHLFDKKLIPLIEKDNYAAFDFVGNEEIFDVITGKAENRCTVILSDRRGNRFFSFFLKNSSKDYHIYGRIIARIDEITHQNLTEE